MTLPHGSQSGLIQFIVLIVILLLVVSYFGINLRGLASDPQTQDNFSVVWEWITYVWNNILKRPVIWIWDNIISFIWNNLFLDNLDRLRSGENFSDISPEAPSVEN